VGFLQDNFLADFFKMLLDYIYDFIGSYGWSIVILTILFRVALIPLDIKQRKNMYRQKTLQPKIDALNRKYANDKEMLSRKTMELYKEEGFNPLSGCLPLLLQMPIFFAFFGALRALANEQIFGLYELVKSGVLPELESWLWVHNIWSPDSLTVSVVPAFQTLKQYADFANITSEQYETVMAPLVQQFANIKNGFFILPLLAGGMSFLQTKVTPSAAPQNADPNKPSQGKIMQYMMPAFSVWICLSSSAAFALYWAVSNLISVVLGFITNKYYESKEQNAPPAPEVKPETERKYLK